MKPVYVLLHQTNRGTYLHGAFVGPFSAMRWAEASLVTNMVWHRIPTFREWKGHKATTTWQTTDVWVIKRVDVWEY
jgi:hypothetical protein